MTLAQRVGAHLQAERVQRGMGQAPFAALLGIHCQQYQRYEHGERLPHPEILVRMARRLNVSLDAWLGLADGAGGLCGL